MKSGLTNYRRRPVTGEGFWSNEDETFAMAMYERTEERKSRREIARI
jgi:hypothetical protein